MLKLRLKRYGKKREPSYRIVVVESRSRRQGRPLQELGFYNPRTKETRLDTQDLLRWLRNGAQPTETLSAILRKAGIYDMLKAGVGLDGAEVAVVRIAAVEPPEPVVETAPEETSGETATEAPVDQTEAQVPGEQGDQAPEPEVAGETPSDLTSLETAPVESSAEETKPPIPAEPTAQAEGDSVPTDPVPAE